MFVCSCMCIAVTAQWYKCLSTLDGSHNDRKREKAVTSEGLFKTCITLEQTKKPHSSPSSGMTDAQLVQKIILLITPVYPHTHTHTQPFHFHCSCISVFQLSYHCFFKPTCCQRSQPAAVPVGLKWGSHLDPCSRSHWAFDSSEANRTLGLNSSIDRGSRQNQPSVQRCHSQVSKSPWPCFLLVTGTCCKPRAVFGGSHDECSSIFTSVGQVTLKK